MIFWLSLDKNLWFPRSRIWTKLLPDIVLNGSKKDRIIMFWKQIYSRASFDLYWWSLIHRMTRKFKKFKKKYAQNKVLGSAIKHALGSLRLIYVGIYIICKTWNHFEENRYLGRSFLGMSKMAVQNLASPKNGSKSAGTKNS